MALIGGALGYRLLRRISPGGANESKYCSGEFYQGKSKLGVLFGEAVFDELRGKTVLDFGSGGGETCVELAQRGARRVIGVEIQEARLAEARARAEAAGVADRCLFVPSTDEQVDVVLSMDAFEHFDDPAFVLREMRRLLRPDGYALIEFGSTWYHPLGGHTFSVFPWAHLLFSEEALIRWRNDFKDDGATSFATVAGGLNQMTIGRWERLVAASPLKFRTYELRPIRRAAPLHNRLTREFLTSAIIARLEPR
ncbi:MAG: class I SAM-dependent methyltransferase [Gemmatimonadales bacterium]|nr:class I SAM-dependent methyltransferase [Gemmatimonadales bacterium]